MATIIKTSQAGQSFKIYFKNSDNVETEWEGKIAVHNSQIFLCTESPYLEGLSNLTNTYGFPYSHKVNQGIVSGQTMGPRFIRIVINSERFLIKNSKTGMLFRRIYKQEDEIIFLGTVQKDIEDCKKPSAVITTADLNYLERDGWEFYASEIPAEKRVNLGKSPI